MKLMSILSVDTNVSDRAFSDELLRVFSFGNDKKCMLVSWKWVLRIDAPVGVRQLYLQYVIHKLRFETIDKCLAALGNGISVLKWNFTSNCADAVNGSVYFHDRLQSRVVDTAAGKLISEASAFVEFDVAKGVSSVAGSASLSAAAPAPVAAAVDPIQDPAPIAAAPVAMTGPVALPVLCAPDDGEWLVTLNTFCVRAAPQFAVHMVRAFVDPEWGKCVLRAVYAVTNAHATSVKQMYIRTLGGVGVDTMERCFKRMGDCCYLLAFDFANNSCCKCPASTRLFQGGVSGDVRSTSVFSDIKQVYTRGYNRVFRVDVSAALAEAVPALVRFETGSASAVAYNAGVVAEFAEIVKPVLRPLATVGDRYCVPGFGDVQVIEYLAPIGLPVCTKLPDSGTVSIPRAVCNFAKTMETYVSTYPESDSIIARKRLRMQWLFTVRLSDKYANLEPGDLAELGSRVGDALLTRFSIADRGQCVVLEYRVYAERIDFEDQGDVFLMHVMLETGSQSYDQMLRHVLVFDQFGPIFSYNHFRDRAVCSEKAAPLVRKYKLYQFHDDFRIEEHCDSYVRMSSVDVADPAASWSDAPLRPVCVGEFRSRLLPGPSVFVSQNPSDAKPVRWLATLFGFIAFLRLERAVVSAFTVGDTCLLRACYGVIDKVDREYRHIVFETDETDASVIERCARQIGFDVVLVRWDYELNEPAADGCGQYLLCDLANDSGDFHPYLCDIFSEMLTPTHLRTFFQIALPAPGVESVVEPAVESVVESVVKPVVESVVGSVVELVANAAVEPVVKAAEKPVAVSTVPLHPILKYLENPAPYMDEETKLRIRTKFCNTCQYIRDMKDVSKLPYLFEVYRDYSGVLSKPLAPGADKWNIYQPDGELDCKEYMEFSDASVDFNFKRGAFDPKPAVRPSVVVAKTVPVRPQLLQVPLGREWMMALFIPNPDSMSNPGENERLLAARLVSVFTLGSPSKCVLFRVLAAHGPTCDSHCIKRLYLVVDSTVSLVTMQQCVDKLCLAGCYSILSLDYARNRRESGPGGVKLFQGGVTGVVRDTAVFKDIYAAYVMCRPERCFLDVVAAGAPSVRFVVPLATGTGETEWLAVLYSVHISSVAKDIGVDEFVTSMVDAFTLPGNKQCLLHEVRAIHHPKFRWLKYLHIKTNDVVTRVTMERCFLRLGLKKPHFKLREWDFVQNTGGNGRDEYVRHLLFQDGPSGPVVGTGTLCRINEAWAEKSDWRFVKFNPSVPTVEEEHVRWIAMSSGNLTVSHAEFSKNVVRAFTLDEGCILRAGFGVRSAGIMTFVFVTNAQSTSTVEQCLGRVSMDTCGFRFVTWDFFNDDNPRDRSELCCDLPLSDELLFRHTDDVPLLRTMTYLNVLALLRDYLHGVNLRGRFDTLFRVSVPGGSADIVPAFVVDDVRTCYRSYYDNHANLRDMVKRDLEAARLDRPRYLPQWYKDELEASGVMDDRERNVPFVDHYGIYFSHFLLTLDVSRLRGSGEIVDALMQAFTFGNPPRCVLVSAFGARQHENHDLVHFVFVTARLESHTLAALTLRLGSLDKRLSVVPWHELDNRRGLRSDGRLSTSMFQHRVSGNIELSHRYMLIKLTWSAGSPFRDGCVGPCLYCVGTARMFTPAIELAETAPAKDVVPRARTPAMVEAAARVAVAVKVVSSSQVLEEVRKQAVREAENEAENEAANKVEKNAQTQSPASVVVEAAGKSKRKANEAVELSEKQRWLEWYERTRLATGAAAAAPKMTAADWLYWVHTMDPEDQ